MKITEEMVQALRALRDADGVLDNAGIFAPIDEHTGYDVVSGPERT